MDAFSLFSRRGGAPTSILKFGLGACIGIGLMFQSVQAQSCNCVESNYYASEPLPLVSFVTTCPAWPANHWLPPVRGVNTAGPLVASYRGELFLSTRTIPYADEAMSTIDVVVQGKRDICQGVTRVGDQALSGWNIVILNHWYTPGPSTGGRNPMPTFKKLDRNILATLPAPVFFPIEDAEAAQVRAFFDAEGQGLAPVIPGLALAPFAGRYRLRAVPTMGYLPEAHRQGRRAPRGTVITTDLMKDIRIRSPAPSLVRIWHRLRFLGLTLGSHGHINSHLCPSPPTARKVPHQRFQPIRFLQAAPCQLESV